MHWDGTISFGNVLTILTTLIGLMAGGLKIAFHLQRSSDAMNNLAVITERLQHAVENQDSRLLSLETEREIQREVTKRMHSPNPMATG
jgi:adenylate kinase